MLRVVRRYLNVNNLRSQKLGNEVPYIHERMNMKSVQVMEEAARVVNNTNGK